MKKESFRNMAGALRDTAVMAGWRAAEIGAARSPVSLIPTREAHEDFSQAKQTAELQVEANKILRMAARRRRP